MRKSVIKSMILGAVLVAFLSFVIVSCLFFYNIKTSILSETYSGMEQSVENVEPIATLSLGFTTSKMYSLFDAAMQQITRITKYNFIVCTQDGNIKWHNTELPPSLVESAIAPLVDILEKTNQVRVTGALDDLYADTTLTVCKKINIENSPTSIIIMCTAPKPHFIDLYTNIILEILVMEFVALLFMAIFLYMFSRNITSPLSKINKAVTDFSKGDFDKRVEYTSTNELGELAENINNMAESIQNLEKMRSDFISDVSHELRTPMTSISGFVEGIIDGTIPEEDTKKYLQIVLAESKRLSRLVNDLLNISRLDSGKQIINKKEFDVFELVKIVVIKFEKEITEKNLMVDISSEFDECMVFADSDSITQVLTNLIHNAVKFSQPGGFVNLKLSEVEGKCVVSVENSGPGIEKDKLKFIWQRFYKTDDSRSNDRSGVGLGLYIVKRIIDSHGEEISVSSTPGESTVFSFTLEMIE